MIGKGSEEHKAARMIRIYQAVSLTVAAFALLWTVVFFVDGQYLGPDGTPVDVQLPLVVIDVYEIRG